MGKKVMSLRMDDEVLEKIAQITREENKDRSAVTRELIKYGWTYLMVKRYREGEYSLGKVAGKLDLSISETIDLLAELGIQSPIEYEDYLKGLESLKDEY